MLTKRWWNDNLLCSIDAGSSVEKTIGVDVELETVTVNTGVSYAAVGAARLCA